MAALDIDEEIQLAIQNRLVTELQGEIPTIIFPGIGQTMADENVAEWLSCYLLSADADSTVKVRKSDEGRKGLIQISCFSRFYDRLDENNANHNRPWQLAKKVKNLLRRATLMLFNDEAQLLGTMTLDDGASQYVNENEIARGASGVSPSNTHAVVITFRFSAFSNQSR